MIKRVLVSGGAGFIGSHIVCDLAEKGYEPIILDNFSNSSPKIIPILEKITGKKLRLYTVDLKDKAAVCSAFAQSKPDAVIHLAGYKAVGESVEKPLKYYENNISGIINLLFAMLESGTDNFIFSSSATVYGEPEIIPIPETSAIFGVNPYAKTKIMSEEILRDSAFANKNMSVISLRYFNPIGAHKSADIGELPSGIPNNLFPYIAQVALGKLPQLNIFGDDYPTPDGTCIRDYIHICDLAEGHSAALTKINSGLKGFNAFNLGTGQGYSVWEIVRAFEEASGIKIKTQVTSRRAGDVPVLKADVKKAAEELNWKAKRNLKEMTQDGWAWYKKHPAGFES
ncbi:UDP-glucose 4-epimerase GalE [Treponema pedis]|uniref:UDP-glucose 4-epimerase GalE n=1 Tax=Treponema pedis TaxID=409322 RepID=UPI00041A072A|nr:UDP-glucose 4-epimerase GalE [Treponema pedis]